MPRKRLADVLVERASSVASRLKLSPAPVAPSLMSSDRLGSSRADGVFDPLKAESSSVFRDAPHQVGVQRWHTLATQHPGKLAAASLQRMQTYLGPRGRGFRTTHRGRRRRRRGTEPDLPHLPHDGLLPEASREHGLSAERSGYEHRGLCGGSYSTGGVSSSFGHGGGSSRTRGSRHVGWSWSRWRACHAQLERKSDWRRGTSYWTSVCGRARTRRALPRPLRSNQGPHSKQGGRRRRWNRGNAQAAQGAMAPPPPPREGPPRFQ